MNSCCPRTSVGTQCGWYNLALRLEMRASVEITAGSHWVSGFQSLDGKAFSRRTIHCLFVQSISTFPREREVFHTDIQFAMAPACATSASWFCLESAVWERGLANATDPLQRQPTRRCRRLRRRLLRLLRAEQRLIAQPVPHLLTQTPPDRALYNKCSGEWSGREASDELATCTYSTLCAEFPRQRVGTAIEQHIALPPFPITRV